MRRHPEDTVAEVRTRLAAHAEHVVDLDAITVVDAEGRLADDISVGELLTYVLIPANRRSLLMTAANGRIFRVASTVCVIAIAVMAAAVLSLTVAGWFGIG